MKALLEGLRSEFVADPLNSEKKAALQMALPHAPGKLLSGFVRRARDELVRLPQEVAQVERLLSSYLDDPLDAGNERALLNVARRGSGDLPAHLKPVLHRAQRALHLQETLRREARLPPTQRPSRCVRDGSSTLPHHVGFAGQGCRCGHR